MTRLFLVLSFLAFTLSALASEKIISINAFDLGYSGGLALTNNKAKSGDDQKVNEFKINLNYAQSHERLPVGMMIKGVVNIDRTNSDYNNKQTNSNFGVSVGLLHNYQNNDLKNSFFTGGQVGVARQVIDNGTDDESGMNLSFYLEAGKRWDLGTYSVANISYAPTIDFKYTRYGGDIRDNFFTRGTDFRINFLKFDILF